MKHYGKQYRVSSKAIYLKERKLLSPKDIFNALFVIQLFTTGDLGKQIKCNQQNSTQRKCSVAAGVNTMQPNLKRRKFCNFWNYKSI